MWSSVNLKLLQPKPQNISIWVNAFLLIGLLLINKVDPLTVVFGYFLETFVIGFFQVGKIYKQITNSRNYKNQSLGIAIKALSYYIVQYVFFITVQLVFVFGLLSFYDEKIEKAYYIIENLQYIMSFKGMTLVLIIIIIYHTADFIINALVYKQFDQLSVEQSYIRILVQQFTVIVATFFILFFPDILLLAITLILVRTLVDLSLISNMLPSKNT